MTRSRIEHVQSMLVLAGGALRVQTRSDGDGGKAAGTWFFARSPDTHYHLRAVLPCELVFDIGDHAPFAKAAEWADAVAAACLRLGASSLWVALSAGKGIHAHVWGRSTHIDDRGTYAFGRLQKAPGLDSDDGPTANWVPAHGVCHDWRGPVSRTLLEEALLLCGDLDMEVDPLLVQPNEESRMCREFGALKDKSGTDRKVLWFDSARGLPYEPIPRDRDAAYAAARAKDLGLPMDPTVADLSHLDSRWRPAGCPSSPLCQTSWNFCQTCPLGA